jgi:RND superfamily putative drug exporter
VSTFLYRLARWCYRHRRRVLAVSLLAAVVVITLSAVGHGTESNDITIPGTESQNVVNLLKQKLPVYSGAQSQVVFAANGGQDVTSAAYRAGIEASVKQMENVPQVATVTDPFQAKSVSADGKAALVTVLWKVTATDVKDSSLDALQTATNPAKDAGLQVAYGGAVYPGWLPKPSEAPELIGILIAFVILLVTFGAFVAAGVPILTAIIGVLIVVTGITALSAVTSIASTSTTVAIMLGLSTGIDYGLFILSRHRAQLLAGREMEESVATAVGTAGSSVVFAGATVIVALAGLSVSGIPFLRTMGLIAAGAVAISVLIALTLLPALLGFAGQKVARFISSPRTDEQGRAERVARLAATEPEQTAGAAWARFVVRFRIPVLVIGVAVLVVMALPLASLQLGLPSAGSQPTSTTERQAYDLVSQHFGAGFNGVLLAVANPVASEKDVAVITERLARVPGVLAARPASSQNGTAVVQVIPKTGPNDTATTNLVNQIRDERALITAGTGAHLLIGGTTASNIDVSSKLSSSLPLFLLVVVGLAFILLTFAFRTILVPIKSILGFLLSVAAALGATVALFQWGWGASLFGVTQSPQTLSFLPTILRPVQ